MAEQTPGPQRAISEATPIRMSVRAMLSLLGTIIAITVCAAIWATDMKRDMVDLKEGMRRMEVRQERFEEALSNRAMITVPNAAPRGP